MNKDREAYIRNYYKENQGKVKVEVKVKISHTSVGVVHHYFNGDRFGYRFSRGMAFVEKKDLYKFREYPQFIIHDKVGAENE